jgi:L-asparaginase
MKNLLLISTGGTISQEKDEVGTAHSVDSKGADTFSTRLNEIALALQINIVPKGILNKDSSNIIPADWDIMIKTVVQEYDNYDAFLITHGTNTLGYTCAALSFALGKLGKPVILTGSQVSYGYPGSDAVMNLENAIRVAADSEPLVGVVAVFGSHIITGVRVKKTTEFEYDAFKTFSSHGSLGRIGRALKWNKPALDKHNKYMEPLARNEAELDVKPKFEMDKIVSLTEFPGLKSEFFNTLVEGGAKGIIYRATGAGDPNVSSKTAKFENLREGFEYLRDNRIPIVVTTQAPDGVSSMDVNDPGKFAYELGAIPAWDMSMEAMTVKLAWLLGRNFPYEEMRTLMLESFRGEVDIRRS